MFVIAALAATSGKVALLAAEERLTARPPLQGRLRGGAYV